MVEHTRLGTALLLAVISLPPCAAVAAGFRVEPIDVPAPAGSRSPNLAAGDGKIVLSWIEPRWDGHYLQFSVLAENGWGEARSVASGEDWFVNWADFPSVVPIDESLWAAHWLVRQPAGGYAYDVHLSLSGDGGASWSDPVLPHDDGTPTEHGFVTLFPEDGNVGLVWLDGRKMSGVEHGADAGVNGMTLRHASFADDFRSGANAEIDGLVCDCCTTDVAIAESGPIAVYRNRTRDEVRDIYAIRRVDGEWQRPAAVADDGWVIGGCPVNGPAIDADGASVAVAWFTGVGDRPSVRLARSSDSGETFGEPIDIASGENFGRAGVALLPEGGVAVTWLCKLSETSASVCLREVDANGVPGPVVRISDGERSVPALNVPQLVRDGQDLVAAWTVQVGGRPEIEAVRIRRDTSR